MEENNAKTDWLMVDAGDAVDAGVVTRSPRPIEVEACFAMERVCRRLGAIGRV